MPPERDFKRPRLHSPEPDPDIVIRILGRGVFQVASQDSEPLIVGDGDLYRAIETPGMAIVDNSAAIGRLGSSGLLKAEKKLFLGFTSPSEYGARQLASSLQMFHDIGAAHLSQFFNQLEMVQCATAGTKPSTHACIQFDFSPSADPYFRGASETSQAAEAFINRIVGAAIRSFLRKYPSFIPTGLQYERSPNPLASFLDWFAALSSETTLFITVHGLHRVLERQLSAAYWVERRSAALDSRLSIARRLLLEPIWTHLSATNGAVRKFLIVDPYLIDCLADPLDRVDFPGLPKFLDLSSVLMHGFSSSQIRILYSPPGSMIPAKQLQRALRECNLVQYVNNLMTSTFTKESVESVFRQLSVDPSLLDAQDRSSLHQSYVLAKHEAAASALRPLLLRCPAFRDLIEEMLRKHKLHRTTHDTVFTIEALVDATPSGDNFNLLARVFMLGLMCEVQRTEGGQTQTRWMLAGESARALLQKLFNETEPTTYVEKFLRRPLTRARNGSSLPDDLDAYIDVGDFDICNPTEQSLSDLILNFFRPLRQWKHIPTGESSLQMILFNLLRAALIKKFGHTAFVIGLLREWWMRQPCRKVRRRYRMDVPPGRWTRHSNLCGDILHIMTIDGKDYGFIYEVKWFDLGDTMDATHTFLEAEQAKPGAQPGKLESQEIRLREFLPEPHKDDHAWWKAADVFVKEISSMGLYPDHWRIAKYAEKVKLPYPLQVEHLWATFGKHADGEMKGSGYSYNGLKRAVDIADDTVVQVAEYRDAGALGVADELAAFPQFITVQELSRDEYLTLRDADGSGVDRPETPEAGKKDKPIYDNLNLSDLSSGLFGCADKRITDMGPGCTVIRAFAIVCVGGRLAFVKELEETRTLPRKIGIVDSSMWQTPKVAGEKADSKADDDNKAASDVHKKKKQYAQETKS